jgi:hypothetical protein
MTDRTLSFRGLACASLVMGTLAVAGCHHDDGDRVSGTTRTITTEQTTSAPTVVAPAPGTTTTTTRQTTIP